MNGFTVLSQETFLMIEENKNIQALVLKAGRKRDHSIHSLSVLVSATADITLFFSDFAHLLFHSLCASGVPAWLMVPCSGVTRLPSRCLPKLGSHLRLEVLFQDHSGCWQRSVHCSCRIPSGSLLQSQTQRERKRV